MSFEYSYLLENVLNNGIFSGFRAMPATLGIVGYILTSLGFYELARRRGISHAWLSWVPVANIWILGSLSDQYRYVARGQVKSKRKILLTLKIISAVLGTVFFGMTVNAIVHMVMGLVRDIPETYVIDMLVSSLLRIAGYGLLLLPLTIVTAVFRYMALYDLYRSCEPENAVLFLVLGIFFSFTEPFFIFFSREKEKGMPPRRPVQESGAPEPCGQHQAPQQAASAENTEKEPEDSQGPQTPEYL